MNNFIVSTSINYPTEAINKFDNLKDWTLVVVGDKKTPKNYKLKNGIYVSPREQEKINKKLSQILGWNCIERRNFGLIIAKSYGAKVIALVDDDNIPYKNWGKNISVGKTIRAKFYKISQPVFDPIFYTNYKHLWHRGFPLDRLDYRENVNFVYRNIKVDVQADFWNGDPDVDAINRIIKKPKCTFANKYFPFFSNKLSPFNSQNTFLDANLLKYYFLFPDQGRMHDIWASYYLQYKKKINVIYSKPSVFQKRNIHNLGIDLGDELIGLKYTSKIINQMSEKKFKISNFFSKKSIFAYKLYLESINENE